MSRPFTPKVVTANALISGEVVYLARSGAWVRHLHRAELIADAARAGMRLAVAQGQPGVVVGPYLTDAVAGPDGPEPTHFREEFRRKGPSNRFHGKQAEPATPHR